jgi:peptidoglycan/xylan/chitin deacetylase (PgdA/CDA1 family)/glycosyltransferase involved in cell wall biosynthesis
MLKLSVVIPTFNRRRVLERTLPSLLAQDLPHHLYELIIVVDGSTDGTAEMLRDWKPKCPFRVLETANQGPSAARNAGIKEATGTLILLLDDDMICVPDLLRLHCESHSDNEPDLVHGVICTAPDSINSVARFHWEKVFDNFYRSLDPAMEFRYPEDISHATGLLSSMANTSIPRELLLAVGGFDEEIRAAEDLELGLRLWKMKVPFRFKPSAIVRELYVKTSREYVEWQGRTMSAGDLRVTRKHPEYRPCSILGPFAETGPIKKWLRSILMRAPFSPLPLLILALSPESKLLRFGWYRRTAPLLLNAAERMVRLRSSLRAIGSWDELTNGFDRRLTVLVYHHVGPSRPRTIHGMTISSESFERQLRWLKKHGYVGITASDWLGWVKRGTSLPKKPVLITFDDAYEDTANFALPLLRKYGFEGTVFVVTRRIGKTNTWDEEQGTGTLKIMSAEQIQHWARNGIEFGGHTLTHPNLTRLSAEERRTEIAACKEDLSKLLGSEVVSFAYPFGEHDDDSRRMVREHYHVGFGTEEGLNYLQTDLSQLRRAYVSPSYSVFDFALLVRTGDLSKLNKWRARLRVRTRLKRIVGIVSSSKR